jgi:hypothetical protein
MTTSAGKSSFIQWRIRIKSPCLPAVHILAFPVRCCSLLTKVYAYRPEPEYLQIKKGAGEGEKKGEQSRDGDVVAPALDLVVIMGDSASRFRFAEQSWVYSASFFKLA